MNPKDDVVMVVAQASVSYYDPLRESCGIEPGEVNEDDLGRANHVVNALLSSGLVSIVK